MRRMPRTHDMTCPDCGSTWWGNRTRGSRYSEAEPRNPDCPYCEMPVHLIRTTPEHLKEIAAMNPREAALAIRELIGPIGEDDDL